MFGWRALSSVLASFLLRSRTISSTSASDKPGSAWPIMRRNNCSNVLGIDCPGPSAALCFTSFLSMTTVHPLKAMRAATWISGVGGHLASRTRDCCPPNIGTAIGGTPLSGVASHAASSWMCKYWALSAEGASALHTQRSSRPTRTR